MTDEEKKKIPDYPELEVGNHVAQTEAQITEAQRSAELLEKRAKRDRDMAIFGDMANLVAKGAAMHGGAWKINNDELQSAKANERLRALQQKNAAQMAEYAKMRVAAEDNERKERNAQRLALYNADKNKYRNEQTAAYNQARLDEQNRHNIAMEENAKARLEQQGEKENASSKKYSSFKVGDKVFAYDKDGDKYISKAYTELVALNPDYKVSGTKMYLVENPDGTREYKPFNIPNYIPDTDEMVDALLRYEREAESMQKANPAVVKSDNMVMPGVATNNNNKMPGVK